MVSANAVSWAEGACGFGAKEREHGSLRCAVVAQSSEGRLETLETRNLVGLAT